MRKVLVAPKYKCHYGSVGVIFQAAMWPLQFNRTIHCFSFLAVCICPSSTMRAHPKEGGCCIRSSFTSLTAETGSYLPHPARAIAYNSGRLFGSPHQQPSWNFSCLILELLLVYSSWNIFNPCGLTSLKICVCVLNKHKIICFLMFFSKIFSVMYPPPFLILCIAFLP